MPLSFVEEPEPDALRRTIDRMRSQIVMQRSNAFSVKSAQVVGSKCEDFALMEVENEQLRR